MRIDRSKVFTTVIVCFVALASASYAHAANFTIGGTVTGLTSGVSVTLRDNNTNALKVTANGAFTFTTALATGATYDVTVSVQPKGETCTVTGGSGTVGTANVTNVKVACKAATFTIGGTVSGLTTGTSVTLLDNGAGPLKVTANGAFHFVKALASGAAYNVTVSVQPTGETCTVTAGSGTVGTANVTKVKVACKAATTTHTIGGTVSGLTTGSSVTLLDNGAGPLKVTANGAFHFVKALASGAAYNVTVSVQPTGETCTVTAGSGTVGTANITTVKVACKAAVTTHTIGGTVSGLTTGSSVTLLDNGGDSLAVTANGKFTFATALATGAAYNVTVSVQPTGETCTVTAGSGTVGTVNVIKVKVACASAATFTIGGTVSGLSSGTSVTLLDNGSGPLKVSANGAFTFATALAGGAAYSVTVSVQPTGETCTVTGGSGTVGSANVTSVKVACAAAATFTIGGTVSGLNSGTSVTLLDNGSGALKVSANGAFTFATAVASGAAYNVHGRFRHSGFSQCHHSKSRLFRRFHRRQRRVLDPLFRDSFRSNAGRQDRPVPDPFGQAFLLARSNFCHHRHEPASRPRNTNHHQERSRDLFTPAHDVRRHHLRWNHQDFWSDSGRHLERPNPGPDQQLVIAENTTDLPDRFFLIPDRYHGADHVVCSH
jgi:hypothetical protein